MGLGAGDDTTVLTDRDTLASWSGSSALREERASNKSWEESEISGQRNNSNPKESLQKAVTDTTVRPVPGTCALEMRGRARAPMHGCRKRDAGFLVVSNPHMELEQSLGIFKT